MGCLNYTVRSPVGVGMCLSIHTILLFSLVHYSLSYGLSVLNSLSIAGLISPWNLPLYLLTWKIAPAVAAGNTVVAKPSEMTSVTAWMMCQLLEEAGGGFVCFMSDLKNE